MANYNNKINVLYVIWSLGLGGAERVVINLAKSLDKDKFNPLVCCLNEKGPFAEELEREGIKVFALYKKSKFDLSIIKKLITLIKENKINIIHTHLWGANLWGRIAAKMAGVKVIVATEHNEDAWKPAIYFVLDRILSRSTDRIIAVSNKVKEFYVNKGIAQDKIEVIYNGIDSTEYRVESKKDVREEFDIKKDEIILAVIGRLVPQKGHRYFLLALKELLDNYKVKGLIIGSGPLEEELKQFSYQLGLNDNVIFTGLRKDIPNLLKVIDILVISSLREGLPIIALEAMASGVPIVATKVGGMSEVVTDGQTGVLVPAEDSDSLTEKIILLLQSDSLRKTMGEKGQERIKSRFLLSHMVKNTEGLYESLLRSKKC